MLVDRRFPILALVIALSGFAPGAVAAQEEEDEDAWSDSWEEESRSVVAFHGFVEGALGTRLANDEATGLDDTLQEIRFRAELSRDFGDLHASFKVDVFSDRVSSDDLDHQIREGMVAFSVGDADLRIGRQVLTWGTGDLVFLNDLFPKDWVSFFAGRETSYLKYPSDSVKVSLYKPAVNLDVVWTPVFEPDQFLTGERFSYFSPIQGEIVGAPPKIDPLEPPRTFDNGEVALRLHRTVGSNELAFYSYRGFFKQPTGLDPSLGRPIFSPLSAWGASSRGPSWGGISNAEIAWYDSRDDRRGDDPLVPNSQYRLLVGHERELVSRLTLGLQYYLEGLVHHDRLLESLPLEQRSTSPSRLRHVVTTRWTYRTRQDNLTLSLFVFFSPSEDDWFLIPSVGYRISDRWQWDAGLNLFGGSQRHTFFAQFEDNSNIYTRLRFGF